MSRVPYALLRSGLFTALSEEAFDDLVRGVSAIEVPRGEAILREGEPADAGYVVLSGKLEVSTVADDGHEVSLGTLGPGAHFGEQALLAGDAGRRTATVRGRAGKSEVLRIGRDELLRVISKDEGLQRRLRELGRHQLEERLSRRTELVRALLAGGETRAQELCLENGDVLFRQHEPARAVYVILSGRIELLAERDGVVVRVGLVGAGLLVGDRDGESRAATAVGDAPTRLLEIRREDLERLTAGSSELRNHLATLAGIWELPQRGFVTQHLGAIDGRPCVTQLFHLTDGRSFVASHMLGDGAVRFESAKGEPARYVTAPGEALRVALETDGRIWAIEAIEALDVLPALVSRAIEGVPLLPAEEERLARSGALESADDEFACACLRVRRSAVRGLIQAGVTDLSTLKRRTGCGMSCGSCVPGLREMLGESAFFPVRIERIDVLTDTVRRVQLSAVATESVPVARPGQHVVLRATVDGSSVERPYTLSSAAGSPWEVTVQREPDGRFSTWLFTRAAVGAALESSAPRGEYVWDGGAAPVVCLTAGIGITPALCFARTLLREGLPHRLVIHWSTRDERDGVLLDELERAGVPNLTLVTRYTSRDGRITSSEVESWATRFPTAVFFLCGPDGYMACVRRWLIASKVPRDRVRIESFVPERP